jgi:uncharacterized protein YlaN (UPF0358 family)
MVNGQFVMRKSCLYRFFLKRKMSTPMAVSFLSPQLTSVSTCKIARFTLRFKEGLGENGGIDVTDEVINYRDKAYALLQADADKIVKLIQVQMDHLTMPQCPLYEEVLDTQMFGLSREIDFAVRLGLVDEKEGKALLDRLERELSALHEAVIKKRVR